MHLRAKHQGWICDDCTQGSQAGWQSLLAEVGRSAVWAPETDGHSGKIAEVLYAPYLR